MAFAKLADELPEHPKMLKAMSYLRGAFRWERVFSLYCLGLTYANRHLTNGHIPQHYLFTNSTLTDPYRVAAALTKAGLWERNGRGFIIHDFLDHNVPADRVKALRKKDNERKQRARLERGSWRV